MKAIAVPLKAIRHYCLWCCCGSSREVELCTANDCILFKFRHGHGKGQGSRLKAIHKKCLDCSGDNRLEVRDCKQKDCQLYFYRMGKNPTYKGNVPKGVNPFKNGNISIQVGPESAISEQSTLSLYPDKGKTR